MFGFLRSVDGRSIAGQGPWILLFALPSLLVALGVLVVFPSGASFPKNLSFLCPLGWYLMVPGAVLWVTGVVQLLVFFPRGRLVTTGAYGFCRNPIYTSFVWFLLPGLSLLTMTWVWLMPALFLALGMGLFIGREEAGLRAVFGTVYEDYLSRVGRLGPRWRGWPVVRAWVLRRPIFSFVGLTLTWSWGVWSGLFFMVPPGGLVQSPPAVAFLFVIGGGLGPSVVGLILTGVTQGRGGFSALGDRLRSWRVGWWWLALLLIPGLTAVVPLVRGSLGYSGALSGLANAWVPGLLIGITAGLMEELGWRGYLLPRLLQRWSPVKATLLLGVLWGGLWHGFADWFGLGDRGWAFLPLVLLLGPVVLSAWSLVQTRVAQRTRGSLLMAILIHASISSSAFALGQSYPSVSEELLWTFVQVGVDVLGALGFWALTRERK